MNPFEIEMQKVIADAKAETARIRTQTEMLLRVAGAIAGSYAELREYQKDKDEERDGDPFR